MKLLVVRHGETQFNAERRYLGALDPELNATGISQARALNAVLPATLNAVVCSPLRRARQTADIVCEGRNIKPSLNEAFRERNVGVFEGLTQEEAKARFPALWAENITRRWERAPESGETIEAVVERVLDGLRQMYGSYEGKVVALVAHGFVAKVVRAITEARFDDFFNWQLANGAVCELALTAKPSLERASSGRLCVPPAAAHVQRQAS
jgi:probable phosphoglycerate mutase